MSKQRMTIEVIDDCMSLHSSLRYIKQVIASGLVSSTRSQKHYSHHTFFDGGIEVTSSITANGTYKFYVFTRKEGQ